nr:fimbrial protein [Serratia entomophila]
MLLHGALVAEPCSLHPGDEAVMLDFGTVIDKYLYLNGRTHGKAFVLRLQDCDISLGNAVQISFSGTESLGLPGLLAVDGASQASGVAIGLETAEGKPLPLNKTSAAFQLTNGNSTLQLQAYVQADPEAIANKSIGRGAFSAVTTFTLFYE